MSKRKDEQWLDDQLRRAIRGDTPRFDAQAWKQKHPDEYQRLVSRGKPHLTMIARLAVAAAIVVATGLFVLNRSTHGPDTPFAPPGPVAESAAEIMTMRSLRMAYEQGGFEALDQQLHDTLDEFGPRSSSVPIRGLFSM